MAASDERARANGFATPASTDLIRHGDNAIAQNARAAIDLHDRALATIDNFTATATTLDYGQPATATISGALPAKVINIGIPKGMTEDAGQQILTTAEQIRATAEAAETAATSAATSASESAEWAQQAHATTLQPADDVVAAAIRNDLTQTYAAITELRPGVPEVLTDAVQEWWVSPLVTHLPTPYPRAVFGGISSDGTILACEFDYATQSTVRHPVGTAPVDDHNAPALWIKDGHRPLIMWTEHSANPYLRVRVGGPTGDITSWGDQVNVYSGGGLVAYSQVHHIEALSDADRETFWVLYRTSTGSSGWDMATLAVDRHTGAVTPSRLIRFLEGGTTKTYVTSAMSTNETGEQVLRLAVGYNPASGASAIRYLELNTVTGDFSSPTMALSANYRDGTGLPIVADTLTPVLPDVTAAGKSRRLFYTRPGPATPAIAYAEWDTALPDEAIYSQVRQTAPQWTVLDAPIGSSLTAAHEPALDQPAGFTYEKVFKYAAAPTSEVELGRRWGTGTAPGDRVWRVRLTAARNVQIYWHDEGNVLRSWQSGGALPGIWTAPFGFRVRYVPNDGTGAPRMWVQYSLNPLDAQPTWQDFGSGAGVQFASAAPMITGPLPLMPLVPSSPVDEQVYWVRFADADGTTVTRVNFRTTWTAGGTHTDAHGIDWTTDATFAAAEAATWETDTFGTAGPRIGYHATANYLGGMAYPTPASDETVYLIRRDAADLQSTLEKWHRNDGVYTGQAMVTSPEKLTRATAPEGGGPAPVFYTEMTDYPTYTDFEGNVRRAPR